MTGEPGLRGRRVVVIGGTSGMGLGAARAAALAEAQVIAVGRRPAAERPEIAAHGDGQVTHAVADLTDEASLRAVFDPLDHLDHLVVTATPPAEPRAFLDEDLAGARRFVTGKLLGSWVCARHAAAKLRPGGSITFLTGCAAIRPRAGLSIVTATFAAVEALGQALALELGPIRVNTIRPGLVDSDMWSFLDPAARDRLREATRQSFPARRIGTIEDIGHAAVFLMTNPYVTGIVLEVSGGEPLVAPSL